MNSRMVNTYWNVSLGTRDITYLMSSYSLSQSLAPLFVSPAVWSLRAQPQFSLQCAFQIDSRHHLAAVMTQYIITIIDS